MVFVDEAGIDNRDEYPYGYSPIGERFPALKSGRRTQRVSWIAALKEKTVFAPMTFEGGCNRDLFEMWLEEALLPKLQPGDVIVIDNASFHKGDNIEKMVAEAGCELWYLPTYSPDLNEIERCSTAKYFAVAERTREHWWFVLKNWMRQRWSEFETFRDCVDAAFRVCPNVSA